MSIAHDDRTARITEAIRERQHAELAFGMASGTYRCPYWGPGCPPERTRAEVNGHAPGHVNGTAPKYANGVPHDIPETSRERGRRLQGGDLGPSGPPLGADSGWRYRPKRAAAGLSVSDLVGISLVAAGSLAFVMVWV